MSLETTQKGIPAILDLLSKGEWQVPQFQREFVWTPEQVKNLIISFIKSYPIGLITIWAQPQNNSYTPGEPLKLKDGSKFQNFTTNPAIIKLVLDGKQRLTTIAMIFGGLQARNDRYNYAGGWFVDLDALAKKDETNIVKYKKQVEINAQQLNVLTVCVEKALIPLKDFARLGNYLSSINNQDIYPEGKFPPKEVRESRARVLDELQNNYLRFLIPIAEIPATVDLGAVCEIFDVLNTTGTNVSTFDLIHNLLFKFSNGQFLLRENFKTLNDKSSFGFLCDEKRQEYFNQVVTGCYLSEDDPFRNSDPGKKVESIKGRDLIDTPLSFYQTFYNNADKIDLFAKDLFDDVLKGTFRLSEIPYPVQVVLYLSLRWRLDRENKNDEGTINALNKIFRAFFWRNTLSTRYDQGFLTQFSKDLDRLKSILLNHPDVSADKWAEKVNEELNSLFGAEYEARSKENLADLVKDDDIKGALNQGITLLINSKATNDLMTGDRLDRFTDDKGNKVQLHHIFPSKWCTDNEARSHIIREIGRDHFANFLPLTASSNNKWKTLSPATAINTFNLNFTSNVRVFENCYIDSTSFNHLRNDDVESFWTYRAQKIAEDLFISQFVN